MQGLLLIDKPQGITSFGAVAKIKRITDTKRVGHTGTLDPMATGVLPILVGRATALSSYLLDADKGYEAVIKLGVTTDTLDITGNVLSSHTVNVEQTALLEVLNSFHGSTRQTPPMYSALKKDGVRLYSLARQGIEIERQEREIEIKKIDLLEFSGDTFKIDVVCSKGTYIRSLADDIGKKLGTGAVLTQLKRTMTAGFAFKECIPLDLLDETNVTSYLLSEERAVDSYRSISVSQKQAIRFQNGGALSFERLPTKFLQDTERLRVKFENIFLGMGQADLTAGEVKVLCSLYTSKVVEKGV